MKKQKQVLVKLTLTTYTGTMQCHNYTCSLSTTDVYIYNIYKTLHYVHIIWKPSPWVLLISIATYSTIYTFCNSWLDTCITSIELMWKTRLPLSVHYYSGRENNISSVIQHIHITTYKKIQKRPLHPSL